MHGYDKIERVMNLSSKIIIQIANNEIRWESKAKCILFFKRNYKRFLRVAQKGRCCFCRRPLGDNIDTDIEHFIEKSIVPDLKFRMENLALSCKSCNTNKNKARSKIKSLLEKRACRKANQNNIDQPPGILGSYTENINISAQNYRLIHPHFHSYSEHLNIKNGFIFKYLTPIGRRTVKYLNLNKIHMIERRKWKERGDQYKNVLLSARTLSEEDIQKLINDLNKYKSLSGDNQSTNQQ